MDKILLAAIFAAGLVLCTGPLLIPELHKLKFGQSIREEGPKSHQAKSGTPTMGGIMIILAIVIATVAAAPLTPAVLLALFITLGHFVLGFLDDYIKVVKKRNLGLKAKQKMLGQILIAIVTMIVGTRVLGIDTTIWIPIADINLDIGIGYYFLVLFVLVFVGGCIGSAGGGLKVMRLLVLMRMGVTEVRHTLHPHMVVSIKIDGLPVPMKIVGRILSFFFLFLSIFIVSTLVISLSGISLMQAMGVAAGCLTSAGSTADLFGIMSFAEAPDWMELFCAFIMIIGRIELFSFFVLLDGGIRSVGRHW